MIRLKERGPEPKALQKTIVTDAKLNLESIVSEGKIPSSKNKDFPSHWRDRGKEVLMAIWKHHNRKCCFCERKRDPNGESDIEHFRPKEKTEDGKPAYWWLAYEWNNLFFSCKSCNISKSINFPLISGERASGSDRDIQKEKPYYPHPIDENPEEFIGYMFDDYLTPADYVKPYGKDPDGRGAMTILKIGLDRTILVEQQGRTLLFFESIVTKYSAGKMVNRRDWVQDAEAEVKKLTAPDAEFAGLNRAFFSARGLRLAISTDR